MQRLGHKVYLVLEKKIFKGFHHGGHLGQGTVTILAIFNSPALRRLPKKFEKHWSSSFRGCRLNFSTFFPYKCMGPIQMHREANLTCRKKMVKRQRMIIISPTLVDLSSLMICAKLQHKGILSSREEDFFKGLYHIWA